MTNVDFRGQIKRLLEERQMSVPELARRLAQLEPPLVLNQQTLYNYLAGRSDTPGGNIEKMLAVLGEAQ